ncbi:MAG: hypothetical protein M3Y06_10395 [Actinomycetota bacterium]|nr:hypothetical protein [Actinomycetota bacterium]
MDGDRSNDDDQRHGVIRDPSGPATFAHTIPSAALGLFVIGRGAVFVARRRQLT